MWVIMPRVSNISNKRSRLMGSVTRSRANYRVGRDTIRQGAAYQSQWRCTGQIDVLQCGEGGRSSGLSLDIELMRRNIYWSSDQMDVSPRKIDAGEVLTSRREIQSVQNPRRSMASVRRNSLQTSRKRIHIYPPKTVPLHRYTPRSNYLSPRPRRHGHWRCDRL